MMLGSCFYDTYVCMHMYICSPQAVNCIFHWSTEVIRHSSANVSLTYIGLRIKNAQKCIPQLNLCTDLASKVGLSNMCLSVCLVPLFAGDLEEAPPGGGALLLGSHHAVLACLLHRCCIELL